MRGCCLFSHTIFLSARARDSQLIEEPPLPPEEGRVYISPHNPQPLIPRYSNAYEATFPHFPQHASTTTYGRARAVTYSHHTRAVPNASATYSRPAPTTPHPPSRDVHRRPTLTRGPGGLRRHDSAPAKPHRHLRLLDIPELEGELMKLCRMSYPNLSRRCVEFYPNTGRYHVHPDEAKELKPISSGEEGKRHFFQYSKCTGRKKAVCVRAYLSCSTTTVAHTVTRLASITEGKTTS